MTGSRHIAVMIACALAVSACSGGGDEGGVLDGALAIEPGDCTVEPHTGSFFRMVQPGGTVEDGPFVANADSPCEDNTWTPLRPGTAGALLTGTYQPHPEPPFTGSQGAADDILQPTSFFGVDFAVATSPTDPQSGQEVPAPTLEADADGTLHGDLSAFAVAWNQQHFNQGAPKPGGDRPGLTSGPTGHYDAAAGTYHLEWASQIVGGSFDGFTGLWRLEGTFAPAAS